MQEEREMKRQKNKKYSAKSIVLYKIFPVIIIIIGIITALYPWISDYIYRDRMSGVIADYEKEVDKMDDERIENLFSQAQKYNDRLKKEVTVLRDPFNEERVNQMSEKYASLILLKSSLMGYIIIPKINLNLPIYYGSNETVLMKGIGHLEGTSLPIGGDGCHSVLTGHTGLNDKKLFTDLEQINEGDLFFIKILNKKLCYKVMSIKVVLPDNTESIFFDDSRDLCTLITCTPYGINDHRLLVTGERCEYMENMEEDIKAGNYVSQWKNEYMKCIAIGLLLAFLIVAVTKFLSRKKIREGKR